jgi:hypothetical protein
MKELAKWQAGISMGACRGDALHANFKEGVESW